MGDLELLDIETIIVSSSIHARQIAVQMHPFIHLFIIAFSDQLAPILNLSKLSLI